VVGQSRVTGAHEGRDDHKAPFVPILRVQPERSGDLGEKQIGLRISTGRLSPVLFNISASRIIELYCLNSGSPNTILTP